MRTRPGDFLAWVLAVIFSVLLVVFAAFLISDWYRADFSRFEKAVSLEERMRIIAANSRRSPVADAAFVVFVAAIPATFITRYFRSPRGGLEFSGLGIKFKGPTGPILLWVVSFLTVAASFLFLIRILVSN